MENKIAVILVTVVILSATFVQCSVTYYYCFHYYMFSMILAVLAVGIAHDAPFTKKRVFNILIAVLLLVVSLSIYQAYLSLRFVWIYFVYTH